MNKYTIMTHILLNMFLCYQTPTLHILNNYEICPIINLGCSTPKHFNLSSRRNSFQDNCFKKYISLFMTPCANGMIYIYLYIHIYVYTTIKIRGYKSEMIRQHGVASTSPLCQCVSTVRTRRCTLPVEASGSAPAPSLVLASGGAGSSSRSSASDWLGVSGSSPLPPQATSDSARGAQVRRGQL